MLALHYQSENFHTNVSGYIKAKLPIPGKINIKNSRISLPSQLSTKSTPVLSWQNIEYYRAYLRSFRTRSVFHDQIEIPGCSKPWCFTTSGNFLFSMIFKDSDSLRTHFRCSLQNTASRQGSSALLKSLLLFADGPSTRGGFQRFGGRHLLCDRGHLR